MGTAKSTDLGHALLILAAMDGSPGIVAMDVMVGILEETPEESQDRVATLETLTTATGARIAETRTSEVTHGSQPTGGACCLEHFLRTNHSKCCVY